MHDLAAGRYRVPWEDEVKVVDGTSCGFAAPTRSYGAAQTPPAQEAAE
jgi:formamidase